VGGKARSRIFAGVKRRAIIGLASIERLSSRVSLFDLAKNAGRKAMGGFGSGRWHGRQRRETVERCLHVDAGDLPSVTMPFQQVSLPVRRHGGQIAATLTCRSFHLDDGTLAVGFQIPSGDEILSQAIPLGCTVARAGGSRICFLCPIFNGEGFCGNPSRRLYAPPEPSVSVAAAAIVWRIRRVNVGRSGWRGLTKQPTIWRTKLTSSSLWSSEVSKLASTKCCEICGG